MTRPSAEWDRVKEIFADALELDPAEQADFVERACGDDAGLLAQVRALLDTSTAAAGGILDRPLEPGLGQIAGDAGCTLVGTTVGRYRVLRLIAEGGMGVVYEAQQEQPSRRVALKLMRAAFLSASAGRRFQHEVEILGRLRHPAVAQIFEADIHADASGSALPYFAMEYVEGCSLTEHAQRNRLSRRERLELVAEVCDGVQDAHQQGIIHRDLKPSNVLVDAAGRPKILDFGIARTTGPDAQLTAQTSAGEVLGTLAYMSPEQVRGDPAAIDTRTDVYALGVILYQLLTGRQPLSLGSKSMVESMRTIEEVDPEPLGSIDASLKGDLEAIVGTALAKEKGRRYASASELAADLRRHLRDEPISARQPTTFYQIKLFTKRHRGLVTALSAVILALVAGVIVSSTGFMRAAKERDRARAINDYLRDLVSASSPGVLDREANADEFLDYYSRDIDTTFAEDPLTRAGLHSVFGWTYYGRGNLGQAESHLRSALSLNEQELGADSVEATDDRTRLATVLVSRDRIDEAEALTQRSLTVAAKRLGEEHESVLAARKVQASLTHIRGDLELAERQLRELVELDRKVLGEEADQTLGTMGDLGVLLLDERKYDEALSLIDEALAICRRSLQPNHPRILTLKTNRALALEGLGRLEEAHALLVEVIAVGERVWGPGHQALLTVESDRAQLLVSLGRFDEALPLSEQVLAKRTRHLGAAHEDTISALNNHCGLLLRLGRAEEAVPYGRRAVDLLEQHRGADHPHTWTAKLNLASALHAVERLDEALALMQDVARRRREALGDDHPSTLILENNLGMLLLDLGRAQEAADLLRHVLECTLVSGVESGRPLVLFHRNLGRCYLALGEYEDAEELLLESHRLAGLEAGNVEALQQRTAELLVELYEEWERPEEADQWR